MKTLRNYVGGEWVSHAAVEYLDITNPATGEQLGRVPFSSTREVEQAVAAAQAAFLKWREVPPVVRARYLFKLKYLMEEQFDDLAATVTRENGKTLDEARGSLRRGIENVEHACGIPTLMMGRTLEDVAAGIDCETVLQPLGVCAAITPFNFPAMVPLWFWPYAVATGNTFVLKPSEQVPFTPTRIAALAAEAGLPPGVLNVVHGGKEAVDAMLAHPDVAAVSFVGSSPVARHVYEEAARHGKRVQALGGAKNHVVVLPDADLDRAAHHRVLVRLRRPALSGGQRGRGRGGRLRARPRAAARRRPAARARLWARRRRDDGPVDLRPAQGARAVLRRGGRGRGRHAGA